MTTSLDLFCEQSAEKPVASLREQNGETDGTEVAACLFREPFDAIVIGGGCNGTGTARDLALRGVRVLLVEKSTWGAGTTGASSGMIHGGLRYLEYDREVTRKSCLDSGYIQKIASHLLFRIPFIMPVLRTDPHPDRTLALVETFFEAYDKFQPLKNGKPHTRLSRDEVLALEPGLTADVYGAVTMDEWGIDPFRLCVANAISAMESGAVVRNHTEVTGFIVEAGRVVGVRLEDTIDHRIGEARARVVVNTTGPWGMRTAALARTGAERAVRMRPGKGIHLVLDRRLSDYAVLATTLDARAVFVMPHENSSTIGTTDDDFFGSPDRIDVLEDEVEYLLEAVGRVFPSASGARITYAFAGLRPTIFEFRKIEDKLTRDHRIVDHEVAGGPAGLVSMIGGKLAAYRLMSEELADLVAEKIGVAAPCRTAELPLPGGEREIDVDALVAGRTIPLAAAGRAVYRHGTRVADVLGAAASESRVGIVACACEGVLEAEVRYGCRKEGVRTLPDLARHTRLGLGACQGARCAARAADVLEEEGALVGAPSSSAALREFFVWRWREMSAVLAGAQLAEAELWRWIGAASTRGDNES
ncbi:MAG: glycerol-3-phosphate dehydrogenase/oxidase [Deltaproteobacteria bacterium]|nr:glycerol-3-phosphate dehydrogenase/oxidase [Deltaproteobacteria bacterium]